MKRSHVFLAVLATSLALAAPAQALTFAPAAALPSGGFYMGVGDLNQDGILDVAQSTAGPGVNVMTGDGDGTFTARPGLTAGSITDDTVIGNFNADAKPDLLVANLTDNTVSMFLNTTAAPGGAPTFGAETTYPVGGGARNTTALADFDADGKLDLAVPKFTTNGVAVLLGNGLGAFAAPSPFSAGTFSQYAAAGSLNGDSKPDLAVANNTSADVSVLLNTSVGPLTFSGPTNTSTGGTGTRALAIGNLNGDANGDLAVINEGSQTLTVMRGLGNGSFTAPLTTIPLGAAASDVAIADLDADGKQDIAVARGGGLGVGVLRGNGNGTFQPLASLAGANSSGLAIANMNADARPDIVTDSQVYLNTTAAPSGPPGVTPSAKGKTAQVKPPPVQAKTANAKTVSGKVTIKAPGQKKFQPLKGEGLIKIGSIIDARKGRIRLTVAVGGGKTETADFYDGVFKVLQPKGKKPVTELRLVGKLENCSKAKKSAGTSKKKRRGRRLWGSGKGRFRTRGKRSAATVRGTIWLVEDRCNNTTFTRVKRGTVTVRDFTRKKNVTVRKGGTYTAPGPKKR